MSAQYEKSAFESLGTTLENLEPPEETKATQVEIIKLHFAEIDGALDRGIPIAKVHEVMANLGLTIKLSTFKVTLAKVRKEVKLKERRAKREAKKKAEPVAVPSNGVRRYPKVNPSKVTLPPRKVHAEIVED